MIAKYTFWHTISPIKTRIEMNVRTANKILEERI